MFLTVTPNSAVDRVIFIDRFVPENVMRTTRYNDSVGGKGFDVGVALRTFGADVLSVGLVAGRSGALLVQLLEERGIRHDLLWTQGDTRTAHVIIETDYHRHSHITVGDIVADQADFDRLLERTEAHLGEAEWLIAAGSLPGRAPTDLYQTLVSRALARGVPCLVDTSGPPMRAAIAARPTIVKLNRAEFYTTFEVPDRGLDALLDQAQACRLAHCLPNLVITCGKDGLLALTGDRAFWVTVEQQQAVNAAGAGDAVSAGLVYRLAQGDPWESALPWAAAIGAATVLTDGTAESRLADVERLKSQTRIHPIPV